MKTAIRKPIVILAAALVLAIAALLLGMIPINAGFMKAPVSTAMRENTGLDLAIGGPLTLRLGANPSISAGGIEYGDSPGDRLIEIESLHGRIALFELLAGRIHVLELRAQGIRVDYCGKLPQLAEREDGKQPPPRVAVDQIELLDIVVGCGKPASQKSISASFTEVTGSAPVDNEVRLFADGVIADVPLSFTATAGPLADLTSGAALYPVNFEIRSEHASASVAARLEELKEVEADIRAEVTDLRSMLEVFDLTAPDLGALRFEATLQGNPVAAELDVGAAELGNSRFVLDATMDRSGSRPHIAVSAVFDVLDFAPLVATDSVVQQPDDEAGIPNSDLQPVITALEALDARLELAASRIAGLPIDVEAVEMSGIVSGGSLELLSIAAETLGGQLSGSGRFDGRAGCPALAVSAQAADIDLATLDSLVSAAADLGGRAASLDLEAASCGNTVHEHRDSLQARLEIRDGSVSFDGRPFPLAAKLSRLLIAPDERIRLELTGELAGEPVQATLLAGTPEQLWNKEPWPVELAMSGEGSNLLLHGEAVTTADEPYLDGSLQFDAPKFGALHDWIGAAPDASIPLRGSSRLRLDRSTFTADKIALALGKSDIGGRLTWRYRDDSDLMYIVLRSGQIDIAELTAAFPPYERLSEPPREVTTAAPRGPLSGFSLPAADIDLRLDAVHADRLDLQDIRIGGRLRKGLIEDARMSLLVENDLLLRGELDVDLRSLPATASLHTTADNLDIGKLLRRMGIDTNLRMRADGIVLDISSQGNSPQELVIKSQIEAILGGFKWLIPRTLGGSDELPGDTLDFSLDELQVAMTPERPSTWSSIGRFDGVPVELWMQTPSLVDTFGNDRELPVRLLLAAGHNVAMLDARLDLTAENEFRSQLRVSGAVVDSEGRELSRLPGPLEDYEISSTVAIDRERLVMPDLQMRLGSSSANGSVTVQGGERHQADVILSAPHLQTEDLLYWSRDFRDAISPGVARDDEPIEANVDQTPSGDATESRGVLLMARELIASFQEDNDLNMVVTVDDLLAGTSRLGNAELHLYVDEHDFRLQPLEFLLPGGGVNAEYVASTVDGRVNARLKVSADALNYGGLLRLLDHESEAEGLLFLDTEMHADFAAVPDEAPLELLLENADGHVDFAAWPQNIEVGVLDLWTANLVVALLPAPASGESSRLNCVVTRFEIDDGLMKSKTSLLDSTDTIVRGRGTIDLAKQKLDLLVWPQAKREKFLSASTPVTVTGTFDNFGIGVKPAGLLGTLIRWYTSLIYVPFKWLTGERFPADGTSTCFDAMEWELTPELQEYFFAAGLQRTPRFQVGTCSPGPTFCRLWVK